MNKKIAVILGAGASRDVWNSDGFPRKHEWLPPLAAELFGIRLPYWEVMAQYVDFTWDGNDECDPASGRGWVSLRNDGSLTGHIYFHQGDASGFTALPFADDAQPAAKASPRPKPGRR